MSIEKRTQKVYNKPLAKHIDNFIAHTVDNKTIAPDNIWIVP